MKDTTFAFADSKIRALEGMLLTPSEQEALIQAKDVKSCLELLDSFGWTVLDDSVDSVLAAREQSCWELVSDLLEADSPVRAALTCFNDFHNLKVTLKAMALHQTPNCYLYPTALDTDNLVSVLSEKRYEELPERFRNAAAEGYDLLIRTSDGQRTDSCLDRAATKEMLHLAEKSESDFLYRYALLSADVANLKVACRGALTAKPASFFEEALVSTENLDATGLASAASKGIEALYDYLSGTPCADLAEQFKVSASAFEKASDDALIELLRDTRTTAFGVEPVVVYYYATLNEIRNVRILLACKQNGTSNEVITERMRELYV